MISVIICTYRRSEALARLLEALEAQNGTAFETIVVDGSGSDTAVRQLVAEWNCDRVNGKRVLFISAPKGLARQRNIGLRECRGDIVCFLDDDVSFGPEFLQRVAAIMGADDSRDLVGLTGYNDRANPGPSALEMRLRLWLALVPGLRPGCADHLGRAAPLSLPGPVEGWIPVQWLPGYCQVYRRAAIEDLLFDESLPTYGGEDLDFSLRAGRRGKMILCGTLMIAHHCDATQRVSRVERMRQCGFGVGRLMAKGSTGLGDIRRIAATVLGYLVFDLLKALAGRSIEGMQCAVARQRGILSGLRSLKES